MSGRAGDLCTADTETRSDAVLFPSWATEDESSGTDVGLRLDPFQQYKPCAVHFEEGKQPPRERCACVEWLI